MVALPLSKLLDQLRLSNAQNAVSNTGGTSRDFSLTHTESSWRASRGSDPTTQWEGLHGFVSDIAAITGGKTAGDLNFAELLRALYSALPAGIPVLPGGLKRRVPLQKCAVPSALDWHQ